MVVVTQPCWQWGMTQLVKMSGKSTGLLLCDNK